MIRIYFKKYILFVLFFAGTLQSQFFYFGRNKVQYTEFDWQVIKTEHFDIYYYAGMEDLANRGAYIAEKAYKVLEKKFNYNILHRIPLIFYSNPLHFQQTNITPGFIPEGVAGFFEFLKGRVVIPFSGSFKEFAHVIQHELVHVFMHNKIAKVLSEHRKLSDRLPPLWFVEGLAEYWSTEWDVQADMIMRDLVLNNTIIPLGDIEKIYGTYLLYKEGQKILEYIAEKYGEEKILLLMENFWKDDSFEDVFKMTIGVDYEEFDREWIYAMKKKYYPVITSADHPSIVSKVIVKKGFNTKPVYYKPDGDTAEYVYFIGNHTGYTSIYKVDLNKEEDKPKLILKGETSDEFEAFHLFKSKLSISKNGILSFITKSGEKDVIHLLDLKTEKVIETLNFDELISIGSASWSNDGKKLVISAAGLNGYFDLFVWDIETHYLKKLTNDIYDDRDPVWSTTDEFIVFSSDRTSYGQYGYYNLFTYSMKDNLIYYLTYGEENYYSPEFSSDGKYLVFVSDIGGARNTWMINFQDSSPKKMYRITNFTTAAFDPVFAGNYSLLFTSFENYNFTINQLDNVKSLFSNSNEVKDIKIPYTTQKWTTETMIANSETQRYKYVGEYSMDIAQSQISTDPVFGTSGGAFVALSDLLGDEQYYFLVYNTAQSQSEIMQSFNFAISRISLARRTNFGYGVFRFSGRRYDLTDPDYFYFEKVFGGYFVLSYPFSKFRRVELATSVSNSEKEIFEGLGGRKALFVSNSLTFVHDNSLWSLTGPIDGNRFKITFAYTTDIQYSNANYYSLIFDYRYYLRITQRSAYAMRYWLFFNEGQEARRFFMGGNWDLRGYPRWSIRGQKLWLISHELRFPLVDEFYVKFPFVGIRLFGFRGALFFDAGSAWDKVYKQTLGSFGAGIRFNLGGFLVLRYDFGKRIENNFSRVQNKLFHQFFFGWDF